MPRRARRRILYDGCYAHIYSKALGKRFIYRDEEDFSVFRKLMAASKRQAAYRLHHYCLMNTHFHLVVSINDLKAFSRELKHMKQNYARWFQDKYKQKGPVWWGRFGSQLIESEKYLYACGLYVEQNPVRVGLVEKPEEWEYSSSRYYFLSQKDELVDNYDRPPYELAMELTTGLNVGRGAYVGTPIFLLNSGR